MRFLANENFPAVAIEALRAQGYDIAWIRTDAPGSSDADVLVRAVKEERVLLTFDKDFGELVFHCGAEASRGIVLFRIPMMSPEAVTRLVVEVLGARSDWEDHFSVVQPGRIRVKPLP